MSLVAGCSLFNGVLLAADSRLTYLWPDGRRQHADIAQKLFVIAPGTVIGFVSDDVRAASLLLRVLLDSIRTRPHVDAISLLQWMPRLFRHLWRHGGKNISDPPPYTAFLCASVIPCRPNVVRRADVVQIVNHFAFGDPAIKRSWLPPIVVQLLSTPPEAQLIALAGTGAGLLYTMESPAFEPVFHRPLTFTAIGTGKGVVSRIQRAHDWLVAGDVGNHFVEAMSFVDSIEDFARDNGIDTVGGLYPTFRVDANLGSEMVTACVYTREIPVGGARIQLAYDQGQWVQRNASTGKEIRLVPPWEAEPFRDAGVFDDLEQALAHMRGPGSR